MSESSTADARVGQDFTKDLQGIDLNKVVSRWLIERVPYLFGEKANDYIDWKHSLAERIQVDARAISLVGSAAIGFSLNPNKNFKKFHSKSDVDVAVISDHHFDLAWYWMRNLGVERSQFPPMVKTAINEHRTHLVYFGTIATDKILQYMPFGKDWVIASSEVSGISPVDGRDVNIRLYRDFFALRSYQVNNLQKLRDEQISKRLDEGGSDAGLS